jgi:hypothetical protein
MNEKTFTSIEARIRAGQTLKLVDHERDIAHALDWNGHVFVLRGKYTYPEHFANFEDGFLALVSDDLCFDGEG